MERVLEGNTKDTEAIFINTNPDSLLSSITIPYAVFKKYYNISNFLIISNTNPENKDVQKFDSIYYDYNFPFISEIKPLVNQIKESYNNKEDINNIKVKKNKEGIMNILTEEFSNPNLKRYLIFINGHADYSGLVIDNDLGDNKYEILNNEDIKNLINNYPSKTFLFNLNSCFTELTFGDMKLKSDPKTTIITASNTNVGSPDLHQAILYTSLDSYVTEKELKEISKGKGAEIVDTGDIKYYSYPFNFNNKKGVAVIIKEDKYNNKLKPSVKTNIENYSETDYPLFVYNISSIE